MRLGGIRQSTVRSIYPKLAARSDIDQPHNQAALRARSRLVEPDVPRLADAEDLEVDAAGLSDCRLVLVAGIFGLVARNVSRREMDVPRSQWIRRSSSYGT